jgi:predicted metal-dependent hydrolase
MDLAPRSFAVRGQTTRWGSCSARGQISLNWKLMAAPLEVIDYVIVHELAHLVHMNHSRRFWDLVGRFHPDWRSAKAWLSRHEPEINSQFP